MSSIRKVLVDPSEVYPTEGRLLDPCELLVDDTLHLNWDVSILRKKKCMLTITQGKLVVIPWTLVHLPRYTLS